MGGRVDRGDGGGAGGLGEEGAGAKVNQEIDDGVAGRTLRLRVKIDFFD